MLLAIWILLSAGILLCLAAVAVWLHDSLNENLIMALGVIGAICLVACGLTTLVRSDMQDNQVRAEIAYSLRQQGYSLNASDISEHSGVWKAWVVKAGNGTYGACSGYVSIVVRGQQVVKVSDLTC